MHDPNALFVDPVSRNFYLQPCSQAIDNSVGSLLDRAEMVRVRDPLGIPPSPILAPGSDVTGQKRVDDPNVETATGFGEDVFIDRGAIDRADFAGPTANLIVPADNDSEGLDLLGDVSSFVQLEQGVTGASFVIRLVDGVEPADPTDGLGVDDDTVLTDAVTISRNGVLLQDTVDYSFSYNRTSDTIRLTPLSGIWTPDSIYVITLNNTDRFVITSPSGDEVDDGDLFTIEDFSTTTTRFEFESGYSVQVPQTLQVEVPEAGGRLGGIRDGETFVVSNGSNTVTFEFDKDDVFSGANFRIPFTSVSTQDEIAISIVEALQEANLGLSPVNLGRGRVHLGSTADHVLTLPTSGAGRSSLIGSGQAGGIADGDNFTLDDGQNLLRFEFDNDGVTEFGTISIPFQFANTHEEIADAIVAAIDTAIDDGLLDDEAGALDPQHLGDGHIHLAGAAQHILRTSLSNLSQTGQPDVRQAFGLQTVGASLRIKVPAPGLHLLVPAGGGSEIADGETFTIREFGGTATETFEFDFDGNSEDGNIAIPISINSDQDSVATSVANVISSSSLGLNPVNRGNGDVDLLTIDHLADTAPTILEQDGVTNGQVFTVDDGLAWTQFQFSSELAQGPLPSGATRVPFQATDTADDLANAVITALNTAGVNIDPNAQATLVPNPNQDPDLFGLMEAGDPVPGSLPHLWGHDSQQPDADRHIRWCPGRRDV